MSQVLLVNCSAAHIPLADESVQMICTSPPYLGLRSYQGVQPRIWGGGPNCVHDWGYEQPPVHPGQVPQTKVGANTVESSSASGGNSATGRYCRLCHAWYGHLGNEPSVDQYVANIVSVCRELRRVLRKDGTFWLNIGDSYAGSGGAGGDYNEGGMREGQPRYKNQMPTDRNGKGGLKPKDLIGVPWRVAFALQADGWWLRSDIIWSKSNPMPENVTDRPTKSHEYLFLLAKSEKYFYDNDAIREEVKAGCDGTIRARARTANGALGGENQHHVEERIYSEIKGANRRTVWNINTYPWKGAHFATFPVALVEPCIKAGSSEAGCCPTCGAPWKRATTKQMPSLCKVNGTGPHSKHGLLGNNRFDDPITVKTIGFRPTCICYGKPSLSETPCKKCDGTGRELVYHTEERRKIEAAQTGRKDGKVRGPGAPVNYKVETGEVCPVCDGSGVVLNKVWPDDVESWPRKPCTVLDPFIGSGTTALAARKLGRNCIGLDLSFSYLHDQARERLSLADLDEWESAQPIAVEDTPFDGLPLFAMTGDNA